MSFIDMELESILASSNIAKHVVVVSARIQLLVYVLLVLWCDDGLWRSVHVERVPT